MKNKILIPTDFSETSINAIRYATDLYRHKECEFYIIHTYYIGGYCKENLLLPEPKKTDYEQLRQLAETNLEKLKIQRGFRSGSPRHTFHFLNKFGPLLDILMQKVPLKASISLKVPLLQQNSRKPN